MNRYIRAFSRLLEGIEPLCQHYGKGKTFFLCDALWAYIKYGVTPNEYLGFQFYRFSHLERARFYTARISYKYEKRFNDAKYYNTFWQKEKTNEKFQRFVNRDWLYAPTASDEDISHFLKNHDKVLVKPSDMSSGRGIHLYDGESIDDLRHTKSLLEQFVVQHHLMSMLNPSSVNTVRVYTIMGKDASLLPHILSVTIRVGGSKACVDNYHAGGVAYPVDVKTGVVKAAGTDIKGQEYLYSPTTNFKMIGFELPHYEQMKTYIDELCHVIPTARLVAWDIAIVEDGFELIEANYDGDPELMQSPTKIGMLPIIRQYL